MARIAIKDLPVDRELTIEELLEIFGRGKFRPSIEDLEERQLLTVYTVGSLADVGEGSLRQAILDANENPGDDTIVFDINGGGKQTIQPTSALPEITDAVFMDATSQPGYSGTPLIIMDGSQTEELSDGLILGQGSAGSTIQGLAFTNYDNALLDEAGGSTIEVVIYANPAELQQQHDFYSTGDNYLNYGGYNEKWFKDQAGSWYYMTPNGKLYQSQGDMTTNPVLAQLDPAVYDNLDLLFNPVVASGQTAEAEGYANLGELQQQYGFYSTGDFYLNYNGYNEKWFKDQAESWYYLTPEGNLYQSLGDFATNPLVAQVSPAVYDDLNLLFNAEVESSIDNGEEQSGEETTGDEQESDTGLGELQQQYGFYSTGDFYLDYNGLNEKWFKDQPGNWYYLTPDGNLYQSLGDIATNPVVAQVDTSVYEDPNLLFNAEVEEIDEGETDQGDEDKSEEGTADLGDLQEQYGFYTTGDYYLNYNGLNEKWFKDQAESWYYLTPDGNLYQSLGDIATNPVVAQVDTSVYEDPNLLFNAEVEEIDEGETDQGEEEESEEGTADLGELQEQYGFYTTGDYYLNYNGLNEKWFKDQAESWYYLTPGGNLYQSLGDIATNPVVAQVDTSVYDNPELLFNAEVQQIDEGETDQGEEEGSEEGTANLGELQDQHGFYTTGDYYLDYNGLNEKWFKDQNENWYYLTPDGNLYQSLGDLNTNPVVAQVDPAVYDNPEILFDAIVEETGDSGTDQGSEETEENNANLVELQQQYEFYATENLYLDYYGLNEKWFKDQDESWYYLTPEGNLYQSLGEVATNPVVAQVSPAVYDNLDLLFNPVVEEIDDETGNGQQSDEEQDTGDQSDEEQDSGDQSDEEQDSEVVTPLQKVGNYLTLFGNPDLDLSEDQSAFQGQLVIPFGTQDTTINLNVTGTIQEDSAYIEISGEKNDVTFGKDRQVFWADKVIFSFAKTISLEDETLPGGEITVEIPNIYILPDIEGDAAPTSSVAHAGNLVGQLDENGDLHFEVDEVNLNFGEKIQVTAGNSVTTAEEGSELPPALTIYFNLRDGMDSFSAMVTDLEIRVEEEFLPGFPTIAINQVDISARGFRLEDAKFGGPNYGITIGDFLRTEGIVGSFDMEAYYIDGWRLDTQFRIGIAAAELFPDRGGDTFHAEVIGLRGMIDPDEQKLSLDVAYVGMEVGETMHLSANNVQFDYSPTMRTGAPLAIVNDLSVTFPAYPDFPASKIDRLVLRNNGFDIHAPELLHLGGLKADIIEESGGVVDVPEDQETDVPDSGETETSEGGSTDTGGGETGDVGDTGDDSGTEDPVPPPSDDTGTETPEDTSGETPQPPAEAPVQPAYLEFQRFTHNSTDDVKRLALTYEVIQEGEEIPVTIWGYAEDEYQGEYAQEIAQIILSPDSIINNPALSLNNNESPDQVLAIGVHELLIDPTHPDLETLSDQTLKSEMDKLKFALENPEFEIIQAGNKSSNTSLQAGVAFQGFYQSDPSERAVIRTGPGTEDRVNVDMGDSQSGLILRFEPYLDHNPVQTTILTSTPDILIVTAGGDDVVWVESEVENSVFVMAGAGDDRVITAKGDDTVYAGKGTDVVLGEGFGPQTGYDGPSNWEELLETFGDGGKIHLEAKLGPIGSGSDHIFGQGGFDILVGGAGSDEIDGGDDGSLIFADYMLDTGVAIDIDFSGIKNFTEFDLSNNLFDEASELYNETRDFLAKLIEIDAYFGMPDSGSAPNTLRGGSGIDIIFGSKGVDEISTGSGDLDVAFGFDGDDQIVSQGSKHAILFGGDGGDEMTAVKGRNLMLGGEGNDTLTGGSSLDVLVGDSFGFTFNDKTNALEQELNEQDKSGLFQGLGKFFSDLWHGKLSFTVGLGGVGMGEDVISGGGGFDVILGGGGRDLIDGGTGDGIIFGDSFGISAGPNELNLSDISFEEVNLKDAFSNPFKLVWDGAKTLTKQLVLDTIEVNPWQTGDDIITGSTGTDLIMGGDGDDHITPGRFSETDFIFGGKGKDTIDAGKVDYIFAFGGEGNDKLIAARKASFMTGGKGDDHLIGDDKGYNVLVGDEFEVNLNDSSLLSGFVDFLQGLKDRKVKIDFDFTLGKGNGKDTLEGGSNLDLLIGGGGKDFIKGISGFNIIIGDVLSFSAGAEELPFDDLSDENTSFVEKALKLLGDPQISLSGEGDDVIHGGDDIDLILGGDGNDKIGTGGGTTDVVFAGEGDDTIGGVENDESISEIEQEIGFTNTEFPVFFGEGGKDRLWGSHIASFLLGGEDNDTLVGGEGIDLLVGDSFNLELNKKGFFDGFMEFINKLKKGRLYLQLTLTATGKGDDELYGGGGFDFLIGGDGHDTLQGGSDGGLLIGDGFNLVQGPDVNIKKLWNDLTGGGNQDSNTGGTNTGDTNTGGTNTGGTNDGNTGGTNTGGTNDGNTGGTNTGGTNDDDTKTGSGSDTDDDKEKKKKDKKKKGKGIAQIIWELIGPTITQTGTGNDFIVGGEDTELMIGGEGNDTLMGVGGYFDVLVGDKGNDVLTAAETDFAVMIGGDGDDKLTANPTADAYGSILFGDSYDFKGLPTPASMLNFDFDGRLPKLLGLETGFIQEGTGKDTIYGAGGGLNLMVGGDGDDHIYGNGYLDIAIGDAINVGGAISLSFPGLSKEKKWWENLIGLWETELKLELPGQAGDGNDCIHGGNGFLFASGGPGNDHIIGSTGDRDGEYDWFDILMGDDGDDVLLADHKIISPNEEIAMQSRGFHLMLGGKDDDILVGSYEQDTAGFDDFESLNVFVGDEFFPDFTGIDQIEEFLQVLDVVDATATHDGLDLFTDYNDFDFQLDYNPETDDPKIAFVSELQGIEGLTPLCVGESQLHIQPPTPSVNIPNQSYDQIAQPTAEGPVEPKRPLLIVHDLGGSFYKEGEKGWFTNLGVNPDDLEVDPLTHAYDDLLATLQEPTVGFTLNQNLFVANYDWRLPLAPTTTDGNYDGMISGITEGNLTDTTFNHGLDYLGYWIKKAVDAWEASHGVKPESVDIIAHGAGGIIARSYIQSSAYPQGQQSALPKVENFIMAGVPQQGVPAAFSARQNIWEGSPTYEKILKPVVELAIEKVKGGTTITGPNGLAITENLITTNGEIDHKKFIDLYLPSLKSILPTYDFARDGVTPEVSELLLDLNRGFKILDVESTSFNDPNTFTEGVENTFVVASLNAQTPVKVGMGVEKWFGLISFGEETIKNTVRRLGDGVVPYVSASLQFLEDNRVEEFQINKSYKNEDSDDLGVLSGDLVSDRHIQEWMLKSLGYFNSNTYISTGEFDPVPERITKLVNDPIQAFYVDAQGRRLGYSEATGVLTEIPGSVYVGEADGIGYILGDFEGPLQLQVTGLGGDYYIKTEIETETQKGGEEFRGTLAEGDTETHDIPLFDIYEKYGIAGFLEFEDVMFGIHNFSFTVHDNGSFSVKGGLQVSAEEAALMPNAETPELDGLATVKDFVGHIDIASGAFTAQAGGASVAVGDIFSAKVSANGEKGLPNYEPGIALAYDPTGSLPQNLQLLNENGEPLMVMVNNLDMNIPALESLGLDRLSLDKLEIEQDGGIRLVDTVHISEKIVLSPFGKDLLEVQGLTLEFDVGLEFSQDGNSLVPAFSVEDGSFVQVRAKSAAVLPDLQTPELDGLITVEDFAGKIDLDTGVFELEAGIAGLDIDGVVTATAGSESSANPGIKFQFDPFGTTLGSDYEVFALNDLKVVIPALQDLGLDAFELNHISISADGQLHLAHTFNEPSVNLLDVATIEGLQIVTDITVDMSQPASDLLPVPTISGFVDVTSTNITVFPGSTFSASAGGLSGRVDFGTGQAVQLSLSVDTLSVDVGPAIATLTNPTIYLDEGPGTAENPPLLFSADEASLEMFGFTSTVVGFELFRTLDTNGFPKFKFAGASLEATEGFAGTLGLGDFLPIDIYKLELKPPQDQPGLEGVYELTADAKFNFTMLDNLFPFTPVLGLNGNDITSDEDEDNLLSVTLVMDGNGLRFKEIKDAHGDLIDAINVGFSNWGIGQLAFDGEISVSNLSALVTGGVPTVGGMVKLANNGENFSVLGADVDLDAFTASFTAETEIQSSSAGNAAVLTLTANLDFDFEIQFGSLLKLKNLSGQFQLIMSDDLDTPVFDPTFTPILNSIHVGELSAGIGDLFQISATEVDINVTPDLSEGAPPVEEQTLVQLNVAASLPSLGIGAQINDLTILRNGMPDFTQLSQLWFTFNEPVEANEVSATGDNSGGLLSGVLDYLPVRVDKIGFKFHQAEAGNINSGFFQYDGDGRLTGVDSTKMSVVVYGGVQSNEAMKEFWPITGTVRGMEVNLQKLVDGEFAVENLESVSVGVEPFSVGPVTIGGNLTFGMVKEDNGDLVYITYGLNGIQKVDLQEGEPLPLGAVPMIYGRIMGQFQYDGLGGALELILTPAGPILGRINVPLAIPLGQTGLMLTGVSGGIRFDTDIETPEDPISLVNDPKYYDPISVDQDGLTPEEVIRTKAIAAIETGIPTFARPFTIGLSGTISATIPGIVSGEVELAVNVNPQEIIGGVVDAVQGEGGIDTGLRVFGNGQINVFGMPIGRVGLMMDAAGYFDPSLQIAFQAPTEDGLFRYLLPFDANATLDLRTDGLYTAPLVGMGAFMSSLSQDAKDALFDHFANYLNDNPWRPLSQLLSDGDSSVVFTGESLQEMLLTGPDALLPTNFEAIGAMINNGPEKVKDLVDLFTGLIQEMPIILNQQPNLEEPPEFQFEWQDILNSMTNAIQNGGEAMWEVFDPSLGIRVSASPQILGFSLGSGTGAEFTINKHGIVLKGNGSALNTYKMYPGIGQLLMATPIAFMEDQLVMEFRQHFQDPNEFLGHLLSADVSGLTSFMADYMNPMTGWEADFTGSFDAFGYHLGDVSGIIFESPLKSDGTFSDRHILLDRVRLIATQEELDTAFAELVANGKVDAGLKDMIVDQGLHILPENVVEDGTIDQSFLDAGTHILDDGSYVKVTDTKRFVNMLEFGGMLADGQLQIPEWLIDPFAFYNQVDTQRWDAETGQWVSGKWFEALEHEHGYSADRSGWLTPEITPARIGVIQENITNGALDVAAGQIIELVSEITAYKDHILKALQQVEDAGVLQFYMPSPAALLDPVQLVEEYSNATSNLDGNQESLLQELFDSAYITGNADMTLLGVNWGQGHIEGTLDGLEYTATAPYMGVEQTVKLDTREVTLREFVEQLLGNAQLSGEGGPGGIFAELQAQISDLTGMLGGAEDLVNLDAMQGFDMSQLQFLDTPVKLPIGGVQFEVGTENINEWANEEFSDPANVGEEVFDSFLGLPAAWIPSDLANLSTEMYTPGYAEAVEGEPRGIEHDGGFRFETQTNIPHLLNAELAYEVQMPTGFDLPYFKAHTHFDSTQFLDGALQIPGLPLLSGDSAIDPQMGLTELDVTIQRNELGLFANLNGRVNFMAGEGSFDADLEITPNGLIGRAAINFDDADAFHYPGLFEIDGQLYLHINTTGEDVIKDDILYKAGGSLHVDGKLVLPGAEFTGSFDFAAGVDGISLAANAGTTVFGETISFDSSLLITPVAGSTGFPFAIDGNLNLGITELPLPEIAPGVTLWATKDSTATMGISISEAQQSVSFGFSEFSLTIPGIHDSVRVGGNFTYDSAANSFVGSLSGLATDVHLLGHDSGVMISGQFSINGSFPASALDPTPPSLSFSAANTTLSLAAFANEASIDVLQVQSLEIDTNGNLTLVVADPGQLSLGSSDIRLDLPSFSINAGPNDTFLNINLSNTTVIAPMIGIHTFTGLTMQVEAGGHLNLPLFDNDLTLGLFDFDGRVDLETDTSGGKLAFLGVGGKNPKFTMDDPLSANPADKLVDLEFTPFSIRSYESIQGLDGKPVVGTLHRLGNDIVGVRNASVSIGAKVKEGIFFTFSQGELVVDNPFTADPLVKFLSLPLDNNIRLSQNGDLTSTELPPFIPGHPIAGYLPFTGNTGSFGDGLFNFDNSNFRLTMDPTRGLLVRLSGNKLEIDDPLSDGKLVDISVSSIHFGSDGSVTGGDGSDTLNVTVHKLGTDSLNISNVSASLKLDLQEGMYFEFNQGNLTIDNPFSEDTVSTLVETALNQVRLHSDGFFRTFTGQTSLGNFSQPFGVGLITFADSTFELRLDSVKGLVARVNGNRFTVDDPFSTNKLVDFSVGTIELSSDGSITGANGTNTVNVTVHSLGNSFLKINNASASLKLDLQSGMYFQFNAGNLQVDNPFVSNSAYTLLNSNLGPFRLNSNGQFVTYTNSTTLVSGDSFGSGFLNLGNIGLSLGLDEDKGLALTLEGGRINTAGFDVDFETIKIGADGSIADVNGNSIQGTVNTLGHSNLGIIGASVELVFDNPRNMFYLKVNGGTFRVKNPNSWSSNSWLINQELPTFVINTDGSIALYNSNPAVSFSDDLGNVSSFGSSFLTLQNLGLKLDLDSNQGLVLTLEGGSINIPDLADISFDPIQIGPSGTINGPVGVTVNQLGHQKFNLQDASVEFHINFSARDFYLKVNSGTLVLQAPWSSDTLIDLSLPSFLIHNNGSITSVSRKYTGFTGSVDFNSFSASLDSFGQNMLTLNDLTLSGFSFSSSSGFNLTLNGGQLELNPSSNIFGNTSKLVDIDFSSIRISGDGSIGDGSGGPVTGTLNKFGMDFMNIQNASVSLEFSNYSGMWLEVDGGELHSTLFAPIDLGSNNFRFNSSGQSGYSPYSNPFTMEIVYNSSGFSWSRHIEFGLKSGRTLDLDFLGHTLSVDSLTMGSNLSFSAGLQKLGNNYLSIEDATLSLQTSFQFGVGTVVTGLSFSGGELHLPIGDPITMPSFSINLDGIGNIYSFNLGSIVPNYTATNSTTFEVELKSNGVVEFRLKDNATFSLNAFGNSMTVNHLKVTTSNYFDADVTGSLSLAVGNNTYTILNTTFNMWTYNNSLRLNLSSNGGTIDNLPAVGDVSISGNFYSSSDFYFSGSYSPSWMSATVKIDENGLRLYGNFLGDGYRNFTLHSDGIVEGTFQGSTKKFFLTGSKTNSVNFVLRPVTTIANLMGNSVSSTLESYFGNATSFFYNLSAFASNLSKQSTYQFNQFINAVADAFGWDVG